MLLTLFYARRGRNNDDDDEGENDGHDNLIGVWRTCNHTPRIHKSCQ